MSDLGTRLKEIRKERGYSQGKLAEIVGVSQGLVGQLENWRNQDTKHIFSFARALGVDAEWLATGRGSSASSSAPALIEREQDQDLLAIPILANSGAMGDGEPMPDEDVVITALTVRRDWVKAHLPNVKDPEALRFIHGKGDSMYPTFNDGDVLLVDTMVHAAEVDGVYVLDAQSKLFIKRVTRNFDGSHQVSSDNTAIKTVSILDGTQDVEIKGRVVCVWNWKRM